MLKIRLARGGKHKAPFYRIVLTEHTRPPQSGYMKVLGWFDPLQHKVEMDIETIKERISKGAQPSNRVAKLAFKHSNDEFFKKYIEHTDRKRRKKNGEEEEESAETPAQEEATPAPADDQPAPAASEEKTEETSAPAEPENTEEEKPEPQAEETQQEDAQEQESEEAAQES